MRNSLVNFIIVKGVFEYYVYYIIQCLFYQVFFREKFLFDFGVKNR